MGLWGVAQAARTHAVTTCEQVGVSSDEIAAFLSGMVGEYEAAAVIKELRQEAAEVRGLLNVCACPRATAPPPPSPMQLFLSPQDKRLPRRRGNVALVPHDRSSASR